jgi:YVTN family beta-propeller protein
MNAPIRVTLSSVALLCAALMLPRAAAAGATVYTGNFADNSVSVVDADGGKTIATIPVAAGPHGLAITPDGATLYVTSDGATTLTAIDTASNKVSKTIDLGGTPNGVTLTSDGKWLLVTVYSGDKIAFVDTAKQTIVDTAAVPKPHTISIRPDGKVAYITSQEPGHFGLAVLDMATRKVVRTIQLEKTPRDGEFGYDGKAFYFTQAGVAAVQVLDPATDKVVGEITTGVSPHFVNLFKNMTYGIVTVQGPGELALFDPAAKKVVRSIPVGKQPHWAAASADGKTAYVTNEGSNDQSVVDLDSGKTTTIAVGHAPRKVVVRNSDKRADAGSKVSIAGFAFNPGAINARSGEQVTWSNDDGSPHTVTFKDGSAGAKSLSPGQTFARSFDKAGTYDYFCSFHPYMTGKLVVN